METINEKRVGDFIELTGFDGDPIVGLKRILDRAEKVEITGIHHKFAGIKTYDLSIKYLRFIEKDGVERGKWIRLYNVNIDEILECVDGLNEKESHSCDVFISFTKEKNIVSDTSGITVMPEISGMFFHWKIYNPDQSLRFEFTIDRSAIVFTQGMKEIVDALHIKWNEFIDEFIKFKYSEK